MRTSLISALGLVLVSLSLLRAEDEVKPRATLAGHDGRVHALAFSPNGTYLASAGEDKTVRIWDAVTGTLRHTLKGHEDEVLTVAFRPDSGLLASGGGKAKPANKTEPRAATGPESKPVTGPEKAVEKKALEEKALEKKLVEKKLVEKTGEVILWDLDHGEVFVRHDFPSPVVKVAYGPKNTYVAACRDGSIVQRYTCTGNVVVSRQTTKAGLCFTAFRGDGAIVASDGGNHPSLWNVTSGEKIASFESHSFRATLVTLSPDGKTLATAGVNELKLWDAATGELRFAPKGIHGHTYAMAFTPDGKTLVTGGGNCHARPENGQQAVELNLWDAATGEHKAYFPGDLPGIFSMAISPDGKTLATGSWLDTIALWDLSAARPVKPAKEKEESKSKVEDVRMAASVTK